MRTAEKVCAAQRMPPNRQIHVVFCSDATIRRLNARFRGIDKATDVLSFEIGDPDLLGEIYISLQRVDVQARAYGTGYHGELQRLLVHGLLHLFGFDHMNARDRAVMEQRERSFLSVT